MEQIKVAMDLKKPGDYMNFNSHDENSLVDPYAKVTTLMLQFFTMEFGSPPLYAEVNRICRTQDKDCLRTLGPYVRALSVITTLAERKKLEKY